MLLKILKNEVTDKVIVVYNGFLNMLTQEIRVRELLPISLEKLKLKILNLC